LSTTKVSEAKPRPLLKSILHSLGTNVLLVPLGFVFSFLVARTLGPQGKGAVDIFVATAALLTMIVGFSLPSGITYFTAQAVVSLRSMLRWLLIVVVAQSLLALALLGIAFALGVESTFLPQASGGLIVLAVAVYVLLNLALGYWRAILIGRQEIISANNVALISRIIDLVLLLGVLAASRVSGLQIDFRFLLGVLLVSALAANFLFLSRLKPIISLSAAADGAFRKVVRYSAPSYLANLLQFLNYRVDLFLVSYFIGQTAVGLYGLAVSLAQFTWLPASAASTVLLPRLAAHQDLVGENTQLVARATRLSFLVSILAGLSIALLGLVGIPLLYGEAFRPSVPALLWLVPGVVAIGPTFVLTAYIAGIGKPHINLLISFITLLVTLTFDLALIPAGGIVGASIASSISYLACSLLSLWFFKRESGLPMWAPVILTREDVVLMLSLLRRISRRLLRRGEY
jgi:O-antigen/teichoic acid export membrane protein